MMVFCTLHFGWALGFQLGLLIKLGFIMAPPMIHKALGHPAAFMTVGPLLHGLIYVTFSAYVTADRWSLWWMIYVAVTLLAPLIYAAKYGATVIIIPPKSSYQETG